MAGWRGKATEDKAWDEFVFWCQKNRLTPLPANAWTIAAYLRFLDKDFSPPEIAKSLKAISRAHALKSRMRPDRDPMVARAMELIEIRYVAQNNNNPVLFVEADFTQETPISLKNQGGAQEKAPLHYQNLDEESQKIPKKTPKKTYNLSNAPRLVKRRTLDK